jgi:uncharacterized protein YndB with AHSA1/START domain
MEAIVSTIDIDRPPDGVFAYVSDPRRWPEWQKDIVSVRMEGQGVGAQFATTRRVGPSQQTIVQEITQVVPPRSWAARGVNGPFIANGTIMIEPLDEGRRSQVTFTLDFEASGANRLFLPLVLRMTRSGAPKSYSVLKEQLEGQR